MFKKCQNNIDIFGFVISTTAYHLGRYSLNLLLPKRAPWCTFMWLKNTNSKNLYFRSETIRSIFNAPPKKNVLVPYRKITKFDFGAHFRVVKLRNGKRSKLTLDCYAHNRYCHYKLTHLISWFAPSLRANHYLRS